MRLVSFTVVKYRSITKAHKISVRRQTVLVGPNNEGKSNLLRALVIAMRVLTRSRGVSTGPQTRSLVRLSASSLFDWERDYPLHLQGTQPQGKSEISLEFELTAEEIQEFRREIRSELNGTLPLRISLPREGPASIVVVKRGPGGRTLTSKSRIIAEFVSKRVDFEHIPAVRTALSAQEIVSEMLARALQSLDSDSEYVNALEAIASIQQPILDRLSTSIRDTLVQFLPDVRDVKVQIPAEDRYRALRRICQIIVDDGSPTLLELKGDGVQSLAALAIMRHASETGSLGRHLVIAIEEPESHLHPGAIHELRSVLHSLTEHHQIVLTTHNPLFVDRGRLRSNIVVQDKRAHPAHSIDELRQTLGVRAADNLRHAELVLVVEGSDDRTAINALFRQFSRICGDALSSGLIAIETLDGGSNLAYKVGLLRGALCLVHCLLDNDSAGRDAFDRARREGLISDGEASWVICDGMAETEIEDLYDPSLYATMLQNVYRVSIQAPEFSSSQKWSVRMARVFQRQTRRWDDRVEQDVKRQIAELVANSPGTALLPAKRYCFEGLVATIEQRVAELPTASR